MNSREKEALFVCANDDEPKYGVLTHPASIFHFGRSRLYPLAGGASPSGVAIRRKRGSEIWTPDQILVLKTVAVLVLPHAQSELRALLGSDRSVGQSLV